MRWRLAVALRSGTDLQCPRIKLDNGRRGVSNVTGSLEDLKK
jgi:hypothetical protein